MKFPGKGQLYTVDNVVYGSSNTSATEIVKINPGDPMLFLKHRIVYAEIWNRGKKQKIKSARAYVFLHKGKKIKILNYYSLDRTEPSWAYIFEPMRE